jgi:hypothetical protein
MTYLGFAKFGRAKSMGATLALGAVMAMVTFAGGASGCGGPNKYFATGAGPATGADGEVEVERLEGGNKMVRVNVKHLPPPDRVAEGSSAYVVWFVAEDEPPMKVGTLAFNEDERSGALQATSPHETFRVLVTAEESAGATSPSNNKVLDQEVE